MPVSFNSFPPNWKLPLVWIEVDPSKAGNPTNNLSALLVAIRSTGIGSAPNDIPLACASQAQVDAACGAGSMASEMARAFFAINFSALLYILPVAEPSAGVKATGTITVTGPATAAGTLYIYIGDVQVPVQVDAGDSAAAIAANIVAAINAANDPTPSAVAVINVSGGHVVDLTCNWKGLTGNDIAIQDSYGGTAAGQTVPAGVTLAYSGGGFLTGGSGYPNFTAAIANIGDEAYEYVAMPFTDSTSLNAWEAEYGFGQTGRWGWMRQLYGHIFSAYRNDYADMLVWGAGNNSGVVSVMGVEQASPTPVWQWAAAYCAVAAIALLDDPGRPLQTLQLAGVLPAPKHKRFSLTELNNMAGTGLATQGVNGTGAPAIRRESTTYQTNTYGQGDDAYELVTTLATLAKLFRSMQQAITSKYPRSKLANDGTQFGLGQAIVTPSIIKAELVAEYLIQEYNGLVEDSVDFKANLIVERDSSNPNRLSVLYPPAVINQLRIFAVLAQFRLQYNAANGGTQGVGPVVSA